MPEGVGYGPQNTASTGLSLNVIGNHAYAYSGSFAPSTSSTTVLDFTTGNFLTVGQIQVNQALAFGDLGDEIVFAQIKMNGVIISQLVVGYTGVDAQTTTTQDIIIPSYTSVEVILKTGGAAEADRVMMATMIGRIYK